ncbi:hypothetical protein F5Y16DRAFT_388268 [Xylariaceae sp. FL0255]|nr:hypothetical protein F5Y16DRAFT_388268 [Xylariaceae sp. FL0255]
MIDVANGATELNLLRLQTNATNQGQRDFCQNQKILTTAYISFSLLILCLTYITGSLIILMSFALGPILSHISKREPETWWKKKTYADLEWRCDETLQLQRLAFEESGQGEWLKCMSDVPVTATVQYLGPLNLSDPKHPRLRPGGKFA